MRSTVREIGSRRSGSWQIANRDGRARYLSAKRTEQRRFRIRLSQQPIQVYIIGGGWSPANESSTLYVTQSPVESRRVIMNQLEQRLLVQ